MEPVHWIKIALDAVALGVLIFLFALIKLIGKPFKSGFYCNDYSVNLPFKPSTVTNLGLILISLISPFVILILTELVRAIYFRFSKSCARRRYIYKIRILTKTINLPEELGNVYINCGSFMFGLAATAVITDFSKIFIGRLRPNFLDVCKPDVDPYLDICAKTNKTYLMPEIDFKCTSLDRPSIEESRLSFPSGHSSLSFYSMTFLILFINYAWNCRRLGLMPRLIQLCLFSVAFFTALSRIVDNKHHPTDVITGALIGSSISIATFLYLTDFLRAKNYKVRYYNEIDEESCGCSLFPRYNTNKKNQAFSNDANNNHLEIFETNYSDNPINKEGHNNKSYFNKISSF